MIDFNELFKKHQATRTDCGPLSIITYKKPDSFENGLRYIFDNELSTLTITGDWLKAVAVNVNNMGSPDRLYDNVYRHHLDKCTYGDYKLDFDIGYLNSKIVTKDQSNSYEFFDYDEVEESIKQALTLDELTTFELSDKETRVIYSLTQAIVDMNNDRTPITPDNLEYYITDDEMSEINDILDKYDVCLESILRVKPQVNDALVVAFEGFKRAYEELLERNLDGKSHQPNLPRTYEPNSNV